MKAIAKTCGFFRRETYGNAIDETHNVMMADIEKGALDPPGDMSMYPKSMVPRVSGETFWRTEHFGAVVFQVQEDRLFAVDEIGRDMLNLMDEKNTLDQILRKVAGERKTDPKLLEKLFLALADRGIIVGHAP